MFINISVFVAIVLTSLKYEKVFAFQIRLTNFNNFLKRSPSIVNQNQHTTSHTKLYMQQLSDRIRDSVIRKYGENTVPRVIKCWNDFIEGKTLSRYLDDDKKILQTALCFVEGLEAKSFHDVSNFPWYFLYINRTQRLYLKSFNMFNAIDFMITYRALGLEKNHKVFFEELIQYESKRKVIDRKDIPNNDSDVILQVNPNSHDEGVWLGPRDTSG